MKDRKRVLLAVDGSGQAYDMVDYASKILEPGSCDVILLHVMARVPEAFRDLGLDAKLFDSDKSMMDWQANQSRKMGEFMEKSLASFTSMGFPASAVKLEVRPMKEGFARDIVAESSKGYDAIMLGRKGLNPLEDAVLGSIATKVVIRMVKVPIWLVGGHPSNEKFLVAVDSSENSAKAVEHVGRMLNAKTTEVRLFHAVRGIRPTNGGGASLVQDYLDKLETEAREKIAPVFEQATAVLAAAGLDPAKVSTKIVTGVPSRAGSVLEEATNGGFGTIVAGRRGLTKTEFEMGRVSFKLVQMAKDRAVWLVGY